MDSDLMKPAEFEGPTPSQVLTVLDGRVSMVKAVVGAIADYVVCTTCFRAC